ncbi:MAG: RNA polymerase sigma factor [Phycisphaerales bacterium]|nr:RNA polymerase sigma factor [Phycisphaerales bacterium]
MNATNATDWVTTSTVLDRLHDFGNRQTWDHFAAVMRRPIVLFACRMGLARSDADDVAQETLLRFATKFRGGQYERSKGRLSKWLFGIAFHEVLHARRKIARREPQWSADAAAESLVPDRRAADDWEREWKLTLLRQCFERIRRETEPVAFRAFERVVRDGCAAADVAAELGISVKAVYNAKHRVLRRVREAGRLEYKCVFAAR